MTWRSLEQKEEVRIWEGGGRSEKERVIPPQTLSSAIQLAVVPLWQKCQLHFKKNIWKPITNCLVFEFWIWGWANRTETKGYLWGSQMNTTAEFSSFPEHSTSNSSSLEWEGRQALFGSCLKRDSYGNCCPPVVNALAWLALLAGIALATFFLREDSLSQL